MPVLGVRVNATDPDRCAGSACSASSAGARSARRAGIGRAARDPHAVARAAGRVPLRWQPAEGLGSRSVPQGADGHPRVRADAGRRRRLPLRHLRGVALPDRRRNRPAREVERPHRALRSLRPGAGDVPGPDHRGDPRRRARRAPHRRGDRSRARPVQGRTVILGVAMPRRPSSNGTRHERTPRLHPARRPQGHPRCPRQEQVAQDRPVPAVDAGGAAAPADRRRRAGTPARGSPGSSTAPTSTQSSSSPCRWPSVAMGQTHALLVGYLDLSVGRWSRSASWSPPS